MEEFAYIHYIAWEEMCAEYRQMSWDMQNFIYIKCKN